MGRPDATVEEKVKGLIIDRLMLKAMPTEIGDDDDLIKAWDFDSIKLMQTVIGLEEVFGIQFGDEEFSVKKFATVARIAAVVREKLG